MNKLYAGLYTSTYMAIGSLTPYIALYFKEWGFGGSVIGTITAAGTGVAVFAVALWGRVYSRRARGFFRGGVIISFLCIMAAAVASALAGAMEFLDSAHTGLSLSIITVAALLYMIMYFFQAPIMSLVDSYTALTSIDGRSDDCSSSSEAFGGRRAWGAVGFAAGVFLCGKIIDMWGTDFIFLMYSGSFLVGAALILLLSKKNSCLLQKNRQQVKNREKTGSYRELFADKKVRRLLLCMFFMGGTNVANNTYFSFLYMDGGGSVAGVGAVMLIMVGSEVPFMALSHRISARITMEKAILLSMIISCLRFAIYGAGVSWPVLFALAFTQGAVNGIILVEFVRYIAKVAPEGCRSIAISAYYVIGSNVSTIVCQFIGGILLEELGVCSVYLFFAIFNLVGVILYRIFGLDRA